MQNKKLEIDYNSIEFNDPDDYAPDTNICISCGSESDERVGYNEKWDLLKRACSNCGMVYVEDADGEVVVLEGEKREWGEYLRSHLIFPFEAIVDEASDEEVFGVGKPSPIRYKDKLTVINAEFEDDKYGVVADVKKGKKKYTFSLCDLEVADKKSPNYKLIDDYRTWFANCR